MLAVMAGCLAIAATASVKKPHGKKHQCTHCTQKVCTPACKEKTGCARMSCNQ